MPEGAATVKTRKSRTKDVVRSFQQQFHDAKDKLVSESGETKVEKAFESAAVLQEKARDSLQLLEIEEALRAKLLQKRAAFSLQLGRTNHQRAKSLEREIVALEQELGKLLGTKKQLLRYMDRKKVSVQPEQRPVIIPEEDNFDDESLDEVAPLRDPVKEAAMAAEIFENELPHIFTWDRSALPTPVDQRLLPGEEEQPPVDEYWQNEHHRLDPRDLETGRLVSSINPFSYHNLHLSMYDTFVRPGKFPVKAVARKEARFQASTLTKSNLDSAQDMLNMAFDHLSRKIHGFSNEINDTVDFQMQSSDEQKNTLRSRAAKQVTIAPTVTPSGEKRREKMESTHKHPVSLAASFASRVNSGESAKTVEHSTPHELYEVDYNTVFPKSPCTYANTHSSPMPVRLVNQKKLFEETRLENTVLKEMERDRDRRKRATKSTATSSTALPAIGAFEQRRERKLTWRDKNLQPREMELLRLRDKGGIGGDGPNGFSHGLSRESTIALSETWKQLKPSNDPLKHIGMKLERVRELLHYHLVSERLDERVNAARNLGRLGVTEANVIHALQQVLTHDKEYSVRYECVKSLVLLGVWETKILRVLVDFLNNVSNKQRVDLLEAISDSRNIKYIYQDQDGFEELKETLMLLLTPPSNSTTLSLSPPDSHLQVNVNTGRSGAASADDTTARSHSDPDRRVPFDHDVALRAAVCLGRMGLTSDAVNSYLLNASRDRKDFLRKTDALYTLVYLLDYRDNLPELVDEILYLFRWSPSWQQRKLAANLISKFDEALQIELPMNAMALKDKIFSVCLPRLWEDPVQEVRSEIAKTFVKVGLFERACVETVGKLDSPNEAERIIAVTAVGSLGIKNPFVVRTLSEMLQFDTSEYVRLSVVKAFAAYSQPNAKILESLRDASKQDTLIGREAARVLRVQTEPKVRPETASTVRSLPSAKKKTQRNRKLTIQF